MRDKFHILRFPNFKKRFTEININDDDTEKILPFSSWIIHKGGENLIMMIIIMAMLVIMMMMVTIATTKITTPIATTKAIK